MEEFLKMVNTAIEKHHSYDQVKKMVEKESTSHVQYGISMEGDKTKLVMIKTSYPVERYEITISKQIQVKK